jgi:hypothetical protein
VLPSRGDRVPPAFLHFPLDCRPRDRLPRHAAGRPHRPADLLRRDGTHPLGHLDLAGTEDREAWQYGKGLQIFAGALLFPWAREHYLWASRALSVLFGAGTLAGAILLGRAVGGARAGWLAGLFYIACPYALVYDRLALTDPALATCAVFVAVLCLRLVERWRIRDGLVLGLALALAVFAKALGLLLFFAPAAAVLLIAPARLRRPLP